MKITWLREYPDGRLVEYRQKELADFGGASDEGPDTDEHYPISVPMPIVGFDELEREFSENAKIYMRKKKDE